VEHARGGDALALPIHVVKVKLLFQIVCLELQSSRVQTSYLMHLQPGAVVYIFTKKILSIQSKIFA